MNTMNNAEATVVSTIDTDTTKETKKAMLSIMSS
jgi:hypothetical protein